ncbi:hypothetical protein V1477_010212 [Vespula maculifrons]
MEVSSTTNLEKLGLVWQKSARKSLSNPMFFGIQLSWELSVVSVHEALEKFANLSFLIANMYEIVGYREAETRFVCGRPPLAVRDLIRTRTRVSGVKHQCNGDNSSHGQRSAECTCTDREISKGRNGVCGRLKKDHASLEHQSWFIPTRRSDVPRRYAKTIDDTLTVAARLGSCVGSDSDSWLSQQSCICRGIAMKHPGEA